MSTSIKKKSSYFHTMSKECGIKQLRFLRSYQSAGMLIHASHNFFLIKKKPIELITSQLYVFTLFFLNNNKKRAYDVDACMVNHHRQ